MPTFRRYLIAGLLIWVPLGITIFVVRLLISWLDGSILLIPEAYRPENLIGYAIPGLGVLLSFMVVIVTGLLAANLFGRKLVKLWEGLLSHVPLVRSVYSGAKQLAETMFSDSGESFRKVLLVEFPRRGLWTLAFLTGTDQGEVQKKTGHDVINVYIPTTPNPTGGYFVMVPKEDVQELDMSVDDGLKMLMSMGAVVPDVFQAASELAPEEPKP
ncbi:MAG: DUF502 domain-containing protein [Gammaproteobacteria bacterium]|nr:DUF502 domain-containing protein [Gammaproteobacteria bacterium]